MTRKCSMRPEKGIERVITPDIGGKAVTEEVIPGNIRELLK
ncbi:hypothetical protein HNR44_003311 [Geomicrobium halophilum]|uniref:Uncharacterized protein n=1 Tax=Geomicrobium halophilum TaxID=549000 RepID=A0A841PU66_9BACL|nr:hypothetical protein [Geomicrobium halophilum]MBB6451304.1 hypothetical protein [Geomicrobium halophilum]